MKQTLWRRWAPSFALGLGALLVPGCGGDSDEVVLGLDAEPESPPGDAAPLTPEQQEATGLAQCCQLGAVCHPGPNDPIGGLVYNCHQLGHSNDPELCSAQFEECMAGCLGDREPLGTGEHGCI